MQIQTAQVDLIQDFIPTNKLAGAFMTIFRKNINKRFLISCFYCSSRGNYFIRGVFRGTAKLSNWGPKTIDMLYNPQDVISWLQKFNCLVKHFFFGEQIREEGILHTGTGHVIQGSSRNYNNE